MKRVKAETGSRPKQADKKQAARETPKPYKKGKLIAAGEQKREQKREKQEQTPKRKQLVSSLAVASNRNNTKYVGEVGRSL